jgi:hypothetical protein
MEDQTNTSKEEKNEKKSQNVIATVAFVIALIIIAVIVMRPADKAVAPVDVPTNDAPVMDDSATTTEEIEEVEDEVEPTPTPEPQNSSQGQVIQGDGFQAVIGDIRQVTEEVPIINSFTVRPSATGETCFYNWSASKAQKCRFITGMGTGVRDVGVEGSLQILAGTYMLECEGIGGAKATSEALACEGE